MARDVYCAASKQSPRKDKNKTLTDEKFAGPAAAMLYKRLWRRATIPATRGVGAAVQRRADNCNDYHDGFSTRISAVTEASTPSYSLALKVCLK